MMHLPIAVDGFMGWEDDKLSGLPFDKFEPTKLLGWFDNLSLDCALPQTHE